MYLAYAIVQAEQSKSAAAQRADDLRRGELALAISRLLHRGRAAAAPAAPAPAQPLILRHHTRRYA